MKKHAYPSPNRRDLMKVGLFAGASLSLPLSRVVAGQSTLANIATDGGLMTTPQPVRSYRPGSADFKINLVHADHDMMGQFEVIDPAGPGDDPMGTRAISNSDEASHPL